MRLLASESSPLGQKVKSIIEAGRLVPNEVVMEIIEDFMKKIPHASKIVFDGIPRQTEQAETFDALMQNHHRDFRGILFELSREKAEQRLLKRRMCTVCKTIYPADFEKENCEKCGGALAVRKDDNLESIRIRLDLFEQETIPVVERYKKKDRMISINADQSIEAVNEEFLNKLHQYV